LASSQSLTSKIFCTAGFKSVVSCCSSKNDVITIKKASF
jgi:hypothetical protein